MFTGLNHQMVDVVTGLIDATLAGLLDHEWTKTTTARTVRCTLAGTLIIVHPDKIEMWAVGDDSLPTSKVGEYPEMDEHPHTRESLAEKIPDLYDAALDASHTHIDAHVLMKAVEDHLARLTNVAAVAALADDANTLRDVAHDWRYRKGRRP